MRFNLPRSLVATAALALAACAGSEVLPTAVGGSIANAVGDTNNDFDVSAGVVNVCAFFGDQLGPGGTFRASSSAGENVISGNFNITPMPHCVEVWNASHDGTVSVAASFVAASTGYALDRLTVATGDGSGDLAFEDQYGVTSATVNVNRAQGGFIWFKFKTAASPIGEGCRPVYWDNKQIRKRWPAPYTPKTRFNAVFANAFPGLTLGEVLDLRGGGYAGLGRHAVAALLNAASDGVNYDYTPEQVITAFDNAVRAPKFPVRRFRKQLMDQKNVFEFLNRQGCPL